MRWVELESNEGTCYVDLSMVGAIGPAMFDIGKRMRALYFVGGQVLVVLDTKANMDRLFDVPSTRPS